MCLLYCYSLDENSVLVQTNLEKIKFVSISNRLRHFRSPQKEKLRDTKTNNPPEFANLYAHLPR